MEWSNIENGENGGSVRDKINIAFSTLVERHNGSLCLKGYVESFSALPSIGVSKGDTYFCEAEQMFYFWDEDWFPLGGEKILTLTPTVSVGGIKKDVELKKTPSEIIAEMLCPYVAPAISSKTATPSLLLYGRTYSSFKLSVTAKKGSMPLKSITIDNTEIPVTETTESVTKSRTFSVVHTDTSRASVTYAVSVKDNADNTVSGGIAVELVGGVFMFFSTVESLPKNMVLDDTTHNCQSARKTPDGTYEITHSGKEYFYIVVPRNMEVKTIRSSNIDVPMVELSSSLAMKQGEAGNQVTTNMRVYRNAGATMTPGTFKFIVNPKDN